MKKNETSFEIHIPIKNSEYIIAALTGEEAALNGNKILLSANSLKDLRSRWNTIMRTIEVSHSIIKKMEE
ncbi:MAG: hypothetical protein CMB48_03160 [Euryarchaeota archaeon]|nr:hypothetical protein [Euryarchaeota archaeon]|tara:strand:- start:1289 stop:1498 length:210 start_codon:yes stop_codon:yes gene_type:complete